MSVMVFPSVKSLKGVPIIGIEDQGDMVDMQHDEGDEDGDGGYGEGQADDQGEQL